MTDYERGYEQGKADATKKMHPEIRKFFEDYFDKCFKEYQERVRPWVGIAQPEQEPVAWANSNDLQNFDMRVRTNGGPLHTVPLYTTPPQRPWVGLTDEEIKALSSWWPSYNQMPALMILARDIENSLKEKNT